jgi:hypothetical protein
MGDERTLQLLDELKSVKNREVEILTELFARQVITSPHPVTPNIKAVQAVSATDHEPSSAGVNPITGSSQQPLSVGDRVRVLSSGVGCKIGDKGTITKITQKKRYRILLDKNAIIITRAFHKIARE